MASRRTISRLIGAVLCAYLVVLQAALGGLAMAGHAASTPDPFSVACVNAAGDQNDAADEGVQDLGCCMLGCVSAAIAPAATTDVSAFRYDPDPVPLRTARECGDGPRDEISRALKRPRGPPAIG